jgi:hypothetical protein
MTRNDGSVRAHLVARAEVGAALVGTGRALTRRVAAFSAIFTIVGSGQDGESLQGPQRNSGADDGRGS